MQKILFLIFILTLLFAIPVSAGIISTGIIQHINSVSTVRVIINSSAMNGLGSISGSFMYNITD